MGLLPPTEVQVRHPTINMPVPHPSGEGAHLVIKEDCLAHQLPAHAGGVHVGHNLRTGRPGRGGGLRLGDWIAALLQRVCPWDTQRHQQSRPRFESKRRPWPAHSSMRADPRGHGGLGRFERGAWHLSCRRHPASPVGARLGHSAMHTMHGRVLTFTKPSSSDAQVKGARPKLMPLLSASTAGRSEWHRWRELQVGSQCTQARHARKRATVQEGQGSAERRSGRSRSAGSARHPTSGCSGHKQGMQLAHERRWP